MNTHDKLVKVHRPYQTADKQWIVVCSYSIGRDAQARYNIQNAYNSALRAYAKYIQKSLHATRTR